MKLVLMGTILFLLGLFGLVRAFGNPEATKTDSMAQPLKKAVHVQAKTVKYEPTMEIWKHFKRHTYGAAPQQHYYLALPEREGSNPPAKLAILLHGGNFLYGVATDLSMVPLAQFFLERGYAVATLDYRSLISSRWPTPVEDIADGIRAVKTATGPEVDETVLVGYSAGAVSGSLLLYSQQFEDIPEIDRFIGISGLYSKQAVASAPIESIRSESLERLSILDIVQDIGTPKTRTPALLIQGAEDYFADKYPKTDRSHAESLRKILVRHRIPAQTHWVEPEAYSGHDGPIRYIAARHPKIVEALEDFLATDSKPL